MFVAIMYFILAFSPWLVYMCLKTKTRAWITLIVLTVIVDIVVLLYIFTKYIG